MRMGDAWIWLSPPEVVDRLIPGIPEAARIRTLAQTPLAILSRGVAGVRGRTLIINLPGSPKAVREWLDVFSPSWRTRWNCCRSARVGGESPIDSMSRGGPLTQCRDAGDETGKSVLCVWSGQSHRSQAEVCAARGGGTGRVYPVGVARRLRGVSARGHPRRPRRRRDGEYLGHTWARGRDSENRGPLPT